MKHNIQVALVGLFLLVGCSAFSKHGDLEQDQEEFGKDFGMDLSGTDESCESYAAGVVKADVENVAAMAGAGSHHTSTTVEELKMHDWLLDKGKTDLESCCTRLGNVEGCRHLHTDDSCKSLAAAVAKAEVEWENEGNGGNVAELAAKAGSGSAQESWNYAWLLHKEREALKSCCATQGDVDGCPQKA